MKTLFFLSLSIYAWAAQFVIIVPAYNNRASYKKNLHSIFTQTHGDYRVVYIDDASTDQTDVLVETYLEQHPLKDRVTLIRNEARVGTLANLYRAISECSPQEIIVPLDGSDWFANRDVLAQLNDAYSNRGAWLTYGQCLYYPTYVKGYGAEISPDIVEQNTFREFAEGLAAPKTFYAGLFHQIDKKDLLYRGNFFQTSYDLAMMLPMLEMAGKHALFMPEVSCICSSDAPLLDEQTEESRCIREAQKYVPLNLYNLKGTAKKVYITPGYWGQLFATENPFFNRDNCLGVLSELRRKAAERGYELIQADSVDSLEDFEYLVVFELFPHQLPALSRYPKEKLILFLWEPPSVLPENFNLENHRYFSKVCTWDDRLIDNQKYFKFYYPVLNPQIPQPVDFYLKRLGTLIACNKSSYHSLELYSERRRVIEFFEGHPGFEFELYGRWWPNSYKTYQGAIPGKIEVLKHYKFCFSYENIRGIPGYVTEKIFDCFQAGVVPIYWGAPNIEETIPRGCFISREDFASQEELCEFLQNMDEDRYSEYMQNIQKFLMSDQAKLYSTEHFIQTFMNLLTTPNEDKR